MLGIEPRAVGSGIKYQVSIVLRCTYYKSGILHSITSKAFPAIARIIFSNKKMDSNKWPRNVKIFWIFAAKKLNEIWFFFQLKQKQDFANEWKLDAESVSIQVSKNSLE